MRRGSVPEVMEDGVTGFIVDNVDEAVAAVRPRSTRSTAPSVRAHFEKRFTSRRMAEDYLELYERLIAARQTPRLRAVGE